MTQPAGSSRLFSRGSWPETRRVAQLLLGFAVPVVRSEAAGGPGAGPGLAEHFEHRFRPISAGVAVPVFACFAGVIIGGLSGLGGSLIGADGVPDVYEEQP
jgi:hypothetical protein